MSEGDKAGSQEESSLLDILIDGFEKNEILDGYHWRSLPMPDETSARSKFALLVQEAARWKGEPRRIVDERGRSLAAWADLEIRQSGRAILIRVRAPRLDTWWHAPATWRDDPMKPIFDWLHEQEE